MTINNKPEQIVEDTIVGKDLTSAKNVVTEVMTNTNDKIKSTQQSVFSKNITTKSIGEKVSQFFNPKNPRSKLANLALWGGGILISLLVLISLLTLMSGNLKSSKTILTPITNTIFNPRSFFVDKLKNGYTQESNGLVTDKIENIEDYKALNIKPFTTNVTGFNIFNPIITTVIENTSGQFYLIQHRLKLTFAKYVIDETYNATVSANVTDKSVVEDLSYLDLGKEAKNKTSDLLTVTPSLSKEEAAESNKYLQDKKDQEDKSRKEGYFNYGQTYIDRSSLLNKSASINQLETAEKLITLLKDVLNSATEARDFFAKDENKIEVNPNATIKVSDVECKHNQNPQPILCKGDETVKNVQSSIDSTSKQLETFKASEASKGQ